MAQRKIPTEYSDQGHLDICGLVSTDSWENLCMLGLFRDFPSSSMLKNQPAMQESKETQVQSLGQEDPLEEGMATHSSILAWRIPQTEEPGGL